MSEPRTAAGREDDVPLVPGGSRRDEVVAWFTMCMEGSSATARGTRILDELLAEARQEVIESIREQVEALNGPAIAYPQDKTRPIDHEDMCGYAYGNSTYPCWCLVERYRVAAILDAMRESGTP